MNKNDKPPPLFYGYTVQIPVTRSLMSDAQSDRDSGLGAQTEARTDDTLPCILTDAGHLNLMNKWGILVGFGVLQSVLLSRDADSSSALCSLLSFYFQLFTSS